MSKVKIQGDPNGTGALTIAAPNTNTDRTLTLPDQTGTLLSTATPGVPVGGPAFSAYQTAGTAQSIPNATFTKVAFQTKEFDTNNCYDSTTNYRFTPTVAGYYQVNAQVDFVNMVAAGTVFPMLYKNGAQAKAGQRITPPINNLGVVLSTLIYMNGTTDYLEVYVYQASGAAQSLETLGAYENYFQAFLARSAV